MIRVLVHDTKASKSLLGQLGVKDKLAFVDTASPINPRNLISMPGLVMFSGGGGGGDAAFCAPLDTLSPSRIRPPKDFSSWWNEEVTKVEGHVYSRRDYVLRMSNKEGGAHVDTRLDEKWAALTRGNALGWVKQTVEGGSEPMYSPAPPAVRQIAFEVGRTLREQTPGLIS